MPEPDQIESTVPYVQYSRGTVELNNQDSGIWKSQWIPMFLWQYFSTAPNKIWKNGKSNRKVSTWMIQHEVIFVVDDDFNPIAGLYQ